ncbi:phosphatidylserine decarboxylase [Flagelloscypha sp. PMI_526]|nr:phosphatidylserine decarboxylase [Flagelloscypha sp. PMI_526]
MADLPKTTLSRYGGWLPSSRRVHERFIQKHVDLAGQRPKGRAPLHIPAVEEFERAIKSDQEMVDLFHQIFLQASPENKIKSLDTLLFSLDHILPYPPKFHIAKDKDGNVIGEPIGVPVYLLFDLLSNTGAAYDLFRKPAFNTALKALLDSWGKYLQTDDSNRSLTDKEGGWFSPIGLASLEAHERGVFNSTYVCPDPNAVNRGYRSWDEFFTREVQPEARPVHFPEKEDLVHSACESTVYRIEHHVKQHDQFWLKSQKYSLYNMLGSKEEYSKPFVGGTIYQAFLSPQDYHRWRAPVSGKIVRADILPGTYYAVVPDDGAEKDDPDLKHHDPHGALIRSQAWITQAAARAIIYIENPFIGLVGFIGVGMAEVSTCDITVRLHQEVEVGQEIGMFHFGGSSHTLIFGPEVKVEFADTIILDQHVKVNSIIAQVSKQPFSASS